MALANTEKAPARFKQIVKLNSSVYAGQNKKKYDENYDKIFGKKKTEEVK
tara:strand:+ start:610 stop:759 length:150 start_codon:yes stop_codon:yes gene_type:complete